MSRAEAYGQAFRRGRPLCLPANSEMVTLVGLTTLGILLNRTKSPQMGGPPRPPVVVVISKCLKSTPGRNRTCDMDSVQL